MNRDQAHYHADLADPCEHGGDVQSLPGWVVVAGLASFLLLSFAAIYFVLALAGRP